MEVLMTCLSNISEFAAGVGETMGAMQATVADMMELSIYQALFRNEAVSEQ